MSSLAHSLVTWAEFLRLPERPETGRRYELHNGEVVIVPPARPLHIKLQKRIETLLEAQIQLETQTRGRGVVTIEFPYRPVPNLQYWFADVAFIPQAIWDAMPPHDYPVYSPPLIVEVLSPSNTDAKVSHQRIVAMSAGTEEFWVVNADTQTVQVTSSRGVIQYSIGDNIPLDALGGGIIPVSEIFR